MYVLKVVLWYLTYHRRSVNTCSFLDWIQLGNHTMVPRWLLLTLVERINASVFSRLDYFLRFLLWPKSLHEGVCVCVFMHTLHWWYTVGINWRILSYSCLEGQHRGGKAVGLPRWNEDSLQTGRTFLSKTACWIRKPGLKSKPVLH